ncbi:MAG: MGMT family protein [Nevskia sp.]|nr:MGMT family protein [Nevskia sp.]
MTSNAAFPAIWKVVRTVPAGRVATYGQVARLAGLPRGARLVGAALSAADVPALPWHRVINSQGRISLPPNSPGHREQKRRLRDEGVRFAGGRVDLSRFGWRPGGDSPLLD